MVLCKRSSPKFGAPPKDPFLEAGPVLLRAKTACPLSPSIKFVFDEVSVSIKFDGDTRFGVNSVIRE